MSIWQEHIGLSVFFRRFEYNQLDVTLRTEEMPLILVFNV